MKPVDYIVFERIVCQRTPEEYEKDSDYLAHKQLTILLENSRQQWSNIEYVYQFCERRQALTGKQKTFEVVGVYLQGKPGKTDYKYVHGLSFLIPVPNVASEMVNFMNGGWSRSSGK